MASILFFAEVIGFVLVALWIYGVERSASGSAARGLFGMREVGGRAPARRSRWKADTADEAGPDAAAPPSGPRPGWRRSLRYDPRTPRT